MQLLRLRSALLSLPLSFAIGFIAFTIGHTTSAYAQTSSGILAGVARDTTGAAIPGVDVTVTNQDTGAKRTVKSGSDGAYRIDSLLPGTIPSPPRVPALPPRTSRMSRSRPRS